MSNEAEIFLYHIIFLGHGESEGHALDCFLG